MILKSYNIIYDILWMIFLNRLNLIIIFLYILNYQNLLFVTYICDQMIFDILFYIGRFKESDKHKL